MLKPSNKYSINHPLITPEFFLPSTTANLKLKSLLIYDDISISPDLIYDEYKSIIDYTFSKACLPQPILIHPNYHMYVDDLAKLIPYPVNPVATQLYRLSLLNTYGIVSNQTIHGNVALFGSIPTANGYPQLNNYSVPYELVEQVIRMYQNYVQN
jgi:hypothetical protein